MALDANQPPGRNFDLTHWYLTLPDATATIISPAQLVSGYTNKPWFYSGADGAMTFWCPVDGGTTANSSYPRSELREMLDPLDTSVNWSAYGTHILDGQCKILQLPSNDRVVIGQIHGFLDSAPVLCLIKYSKGTIEAQVRMKPEDADYAHLPLVTKVPIDALITYQIKLVNGLLSVNLNGVTASANIFANGSTWTNQGLYFKAGSYCQDNVGPTSEGSRVAFYRLNATHAHVPAAPVIAKEPVSQATNAGVFVSFRTLVTGTPPLFFQWRKNGAPLPTSTNSLLVFSNAAAADVASYRCIVTNNFGSVTSALVNLNLTNLPSQFALGINASNARVRLKWPAAPGKTYRLLYKRNFSDTNWTLALTNIPVNGGSAIVEETADQPQRFYRVSEN